jgi:hypothetical protein
MSLFNLVGNLLTPTYDSLYIVNSPILEEAVNDHGAVIDGIVGTLVMKEDPTDVAVQMQDRISSTQKFASNGVSTYSTNTVEYRIFFSCPMIERTDKILQTRVRLGQSKTTTFRSYFANIDVPWHSWLFFMAIYLFVDSLSLLPIGILSRFRKNNSTNGQQAWILCWMVVGIVIGPIAGLLDCVLHYRSKTKKHLSRAGKTVVLLLLALMSVSGIGGFVVVGRMLREYGDCAV